MTMTKTTPKAQAQENLLEALVVAFYRVADDDELTDRQRAILRDQMDKQMKRVEKLFGYEPGSWGRS